MNPGLINLWAYDCCKKYFHGDHISITQAIVSEYDSQTPKIPRRQGQFINTWSTDGFLEEARSPVEGHSLGKYFTDSKIDGVNALSTSLRPDGSKFQGYTVRHAEAITMHRFFPNATIMYIYKCPDAAMESMKEYDTVREIKEKKTLFVNDIKYGIDELGILMTDNKKVIWYGSVLSNDDMKKKPLKKYLNATTFQVAGGLYFGIKSLIYFLHHKIYNLLSAEDIVNFIPNYEDELKYVNKKMKVKVYEITGKNADDFIKKSSFPDHYA
jgi:homospermidine synthase